MVKLPPRQTNKMPSQYQLFAQTNEDKDPYYANKLNQLISHKKSASNSSYLAATKSFEQKKSPRVYQNLTQTFKRVQEAFRGTQSKDRQTVGSQEDETRKSYFKS